MAAAGASLEFATGKSWKIDLFKLILAEQEEIIKSWITNAVINERERFGLMTFQKDSLHILLYRHVKTPDKVHLLRVTQTALDEANMKLWKKLTDDLKEKNHE